MGLYGISTLSRADARREGTSIFLDGEIAAALHLTPQLSLQAALKSEPAAEAEPNGGLVGFRYQAAFIEQLFAEWSPRDEIRLHGGKFTAPFGRGFHDFPGVLTALRAGDVYEIAESLGFGATWTFLSDPTLGEHDLSAAVFTLDTSFLSNTFITRERCCREGFDRFSRNSRRQGGPGNSGRLNNFAIALDGDRFAWLPDFSYHLSVVSRAHGTDGSAREWGYAAGLRYELSLTPELRTLFFAEHVEFRSAGGRAIETVEVPAGEEGAEPTMLDVPVAERRRFTTIGAQTSYGPWRATLAWQRDQRKRSVNTIPTEQFLEISAGRDLGWGFGLDVGYQYSRYARDDGTRGQANAIVRVLRFRQDF